MSDTRVLALIDDLLKAGTESSWIEFKENNIDPKAIGIRISALANAARLADKHFAYMVWGIRDSDHEIVSTAFEPEKEKVQRDPLEFWLGFDYSHKI